MKIISIQPSSFTDHITAEGVELQKLPYPFHILPKGEVDYQDFWRGDPYRLIGFQNEVHSHHVDLWWADAAKAPQSIVGKYPVFVRKDGDMYTYTISIQSVVERELPDPPPAWTLASEWPDHLAEAGGLTMEIKITEEQRKTLLDLVEETGEDDNDYESAIGGWVAWQERCEALAAAVAPLIREP